MGLQRYCICSDEQCQSGCFEIAPLFSSRTGDTTTRVEIWRCAECGSRWLRSTIENEDHPAWNKWYRTPAVREGFGAEDELTPEAAADIMGRATWHYYGGPYYRSSGERSSGAVPGFAPEVMARAA